MSGWGIADTASEIEKIKAESADYLRGLNSCGLIDWNTYDKAFDFYMGLIDASYEQGKKDAKQRWIPVAKNQPEEDEQVFVYLFGDSPYIAWIDSNGEWNTEDFTLDKEEDREDEPVAWMPLPEAWRGEQE